MNQHSKLIVLVVVIGLILSSSIGYYMGQAFYTTPNVYLDAIPTGWIIQADGLGWYAANYNGQTVYSSVNSSYIFNTVSNSLTSGGTIKVTRGIYNQLGSWMITQSNVDIIFEQGATLVAGTNSLVPMLYFYYVQNCSVTNPTLNGKASTQTGTSWTFPAEPDGIVTQASSHIRIINPHISNIRVVGIYFRGEGLGTSQHNSVEGGKVSYVGWDGMGSSSTDMYSSFTGVDVSYCSDVGISLYGINSKIVNCYIHNMIGTTGYAGINTGWGIGLEGGRNHLVLGNMVRNTKSGIIISSQSVASFGILTNSTISQNTVINASTTGISLSTLSNHNKVSENFISEGCAYDIYSYGGISVRNATFNELKENTITLISGAGIQMDEYAYNNTVSFNEIYNNGAGSVGHQIGIYTNGSSNLFSSNRIYDTRAGASRKQSYGLYLDTGATTNIVIVNVIWNHPTADYTDSGTDTIYQSNVVAGVWVA